MDLRTASRQVIEKELKPFLLQAIKIHPLPVDIKVIRGNIVTVRDYARRYLIGVRKIGIDKISATIFNALKPRIRVYLNSEGITFAGMNQKRLPNLHWENYKLPFEVIEAKDARWTALAVNPSEAEISQLARMISCGVISPVEMRTRFTPLQVANFTKDYEPHVFRLGKNIMMWPKPKLENK